MVRSRRVTAVTSISATMQWDTVAGATLYRVYRSIDGKDWERVTNGPSTTHTATLVAGKTYRYYVVAANAVGESAPSKVLPATVPMTPTNFKLTASTATTATMQWDTVPGATLYRVYRSIDNGDWVRVTSSAATTYSPTLTAGKNYRFYVVAANAIGESKPSNIITIGQPSVPAPPANFQITAVTSISATMQWDTVAGATLYRVYRSINYGGNWERVTNGPATTYTPTLAAGKTYQYYVVAANAVGESAPSNIITISPIGASPTTALVSSPVTALATALLTEPFADSDVTLFDKALGLYFDEIESFV